MRAPVGFSDETVPIEGTSASVFRSFGLDASGSPEGVMVPWSSMGFSDLRARMANLDGTVTYRK